jgi:hypothetical protein
MRSFRLKVSKCVAITVLRSQSLSSSLSCLSRCSYRMRSHGCSSYWGAGCKQLQQRCDRSFATVTNWVVFLAVDLVLGSTRRPFNLYFEVCLKALRLVLIIQKRIDYDYCVFYLASSDLISMFNLGAAHLQLQLYPSVSLCIVHRDHMLSVSSSNTPPHSAYLTCSLIISLLLVSFTVSLNMYFVTKLIVVWVSCRC